MGLLAANGVEREKLKTLQTWPEKNTQQKIYSSFFISTLMETSGERRSVPQSKSGSNGWNGAVGLLLAASSNASSGMDQSSGTGDGDRRFSGSTFRISSTLSRSWHQAPCMMFCIIFWRKMRVRASFTSCGWRERASLKRSPGLKTTVSAVSG